MHWLAEIVRSKLLNCGRRLGRTHGRMSSVWKHNHIIADDETFMLGSCGLQEVQSEIALSEQTVVQNRCAARDIYTVGPDNLRDYAAAVSEYLLAPCRRTRGCIDLAADQVCAERGIYGFGASE